MQIRNTKRGVWVPLSGTNATGVPVGKVIAISTSSITIAAERESDFQSVRGTDKIVGGEDKEVTASPQTAPVESEPNPTESR